MKSKSDIRKLKHIRLARYVLLGLSRFIDRRAYRITYKIDMLCVKLRKDIDNIHRKYD